MSISVGVAILAAGEGKRLALSSPKPLASSLGQALIDYPLSAVKHFTLHHQLRSQIGVVIGHQRELVQQYLERKYVGAGDLQLHYAIQEHQRGTADALRSYFNACVWAKEMDYTLVICADTPLIRASDLSRLYQELVAQKLDGVVATFQQANPFGYGRIVAGTDPLGGNAGLHIVEEKDADAATKQICEVNSGLYLLKTSFVLAHLFQIGNNNRSGEFYLTDLFQDHRAVRAVFFSQGEKFLGVNDLGQLEEVTRYLKMEKNRQLQQQGVRFIDASTCFLDWSVEVGPGTVIYPNNIIEGHTVIGKNVTLYPGSVISNTTIGNNVEIRPYCHLEDSRIADRAQIGPFAHLRPETEIGPEVKIGNFVEIKKSQLLAKSKVSHLSYVGDATIGEETNLGCGFITCNYDGANKHRTVIGKGSFIGSDSQMVAPVNVGDYCYIASGSTITQDMPDHAFAIARERQVTKPLMAQRFLARKKKKGPES